ncbi:MAG: hypothetical protein RL367_1804, partial [Pseudomonadota bacterium]
MATLDIQPLQDGLPFGVRITGATRADLDDAAVRQQLVAAFEQHGMIVFSAVNPSNAMQVALSEVFGPLKDHPVAGVERVDPALPGVVAINSPPGSGGVVALGGQRLSHWLPWHFDHCYNNELNRAGVLRAIEIVPQGGVTGFADGVAIYRAFPKDLLAQIEGREIVYTLAVQYETMRFGRPDSFAVIRPKPSPPGFEDQARSMPRALHPAVWTRATGEKVLHISPWMAAGIAGAEDADGDALLEAVSQEIRRLADLKSYHHHWQSDEMVIWDNLLMLLFVYGNFTGLLCIMLRTSIMGY